MPFSEYAPVYDFDASDDFLQTLSGAIPSLSPALLTGDDNQSFTESNMNQDNSSSSVDGNNNFDANVDFMNPNAMNDDLSPTSGWVDPQQQQQQQQQAPVQQFYTQQLFPQQQLQQSQQIPVQPLFEANLLENDRKSSSLSTTNSGYHSAASNVLSPVSNNSISSAHTSPEYAPNIKQEEDSLPHASISSASSSVHAGINASASTITSKNSKSIKSQKKDKCSHNMIEKKYRTNINSKILALRDAVPSLRIAIGDSKDISIADLEGLTPASKLNKASVLTKATEYIKHLEKKNDILKNQNIELQRIIQEANTRQHQHQHQQLHQQHQHQHQPLQQQYNMNPQQGFGFVPNMHEQSYNTTVNIPQQSYGNNFIPQAHQQPQLSTGQKVLLGGLATVMGTSIFSGATDGDFKGLSSVPFLPMLLSGAKSSQMTVQAFGLLKNLILLAAMANLVYPYFVPMTQQIIVGEGEGNDKAVKDLTSFKLWKDYFYINYGFQLPNVIDESKKTEILSRLNGKTGSPISYCQLINDYIYLSSCELKFENCFLTLIVGKLLINKIPILKKVLEFNMSLKASILINLEYKGEDVNLIKLNHLIHDLDKVSIFGSEELFKRLMNIADKESINFGINDGLNRLKYVELYQEQIDSYYGIIFSWRILELTHQLNLKYLDILGKDEGMDESVLAIEKDTEKISKLLNKQVGEGEISIKLRKYFNLFRAVISPETHGLELKEEIQNDVEKYLANFKTLTQGQELTDSATLASEEDLKKEVEVELEEDGEVDEEIELDAADFEDEDGEEDIYIENKLSNQKALISSLNLVSQDQFIILTSALVLYYNQRDEEQATRLLGYFSFQNDEIELSYFSFTILLKVIMKLSVENREHNEALDKLIRIVRIWLNDESRNEVLNLKTRGNLSNLVVEKGMVLNGISEETEDN